MKSGQKILKSERLKQLYFLEHQGIDPYPGSIPTRTHRNNQVTTNYGELETQTVSVVGRLTAIREHPKRLFFDLEDESGRVQITLVHTHGTEKMFALFRQGFSTGDFISVTGKVIKTKSGEVTVDASEIKMLSKALLPPPTRWIGLKDTETRYRQRYLDLMLNREVRERFMFRSRMVEFMRQRFIQLGCWEMETPVLDSTYGGASARPFVTRHNALSANLFLRISNELYLKRLIAGGFEGVFEFSRDFRNEGIDKTHNPEFTQVELYVAYKDYLWMMEIAENLVQDIAKHYLGSTKIFYQGKQIELSAPWKRITIYDGVRQALGIDPEEISDVELSKIASNYGITEVDRGYILVELFDKLVTPELVNPTFVIDYPESTSPLTKKHRESKGLVERFECVVAGIEVMNCYTELNDPRKQRANFDAELRRREEGDEKAMPVDDDFIVAMEYGMPPMGGIGISIDRWAMIFTNADHIKEVIAFPTLKAKE